MKYLSLILLILVASCQVGDFPQERVALYKANQPDCQKEPQKCISGYPW